MDFDVELAAAIAEDKAANEELMETQTLINAARKNIEDLELNGAEIESLDEARGKEYVVGLKFTRVQGRASSAARKLADMTNNEDAIRALYEEVNLAMETIRQTLDILPDSNRATFMDLIDKAIGVKHPYYPYLQELKAGD